MLYNSVTTIYQHPKSSSSSHEEMSHSISKNLETPMRNKPENFSKLIITHCLLQVVPHSIIHTLATFVITCYLQPLVLKKAPSRYFVGCVAFDLPPEPPPPPPTAMPPPSESSRKHQTHFTWHMWCLWGTRYKPPAW